MALMISSQHLHEVEAVADRIVFLKGGIILFNGPVGDLGQARRYNTYELRCSVDSHTLEDILNGLFHTITFNGLSFVVTAPLSISVHAILTRLLARDVTIEYFRDLSHSVKQLFQ
jgi:ABC-2 type transport system ATP-binding protein